MGLFGVDFSKPIKCLKIKFNVYTLMTYIKQEIISIFIYRLLISTLSSLNKPPSQTKRAMWKWSENNIKNTFSKMIGVINESPELIMDRFDRRT